MKTLIYPLILFFAIVSCGLADDNDGYVAASDGRASRVSRSVSVGCLSCLPSFSWWTVVYALSGTRPPSEMINPLLDAENRRDAGDGNADG